MGSLAAAPLPLTRQAADHFTFLDLTLITVTVKHCCCNGKYLPQKSMVKGNWQCFSDKASRADLIPKLRSLFAEFLDEESLVHLGLLDLSTCVGLRYGRL